MNQFTKEELEVLLSNHWSCGADYEGLYDKIKSMIDNYCEHDFIPCLGTVDLEICSKPDCMVLR